MYDPRRSWIGGIRLGVNHVSISDIDELRLPISIHIGDQGIFALHRRKDHILLPPASLVSRIHIKYCAQTKVSGDDIRPSIAGKVLGMLYPGRVLGRRVEGPGGIHLPRRREVRTEED